jgi:aspartyl-tRNA(Asn)/glutamyl-tRNA(Gln) amidotransferase subunit A
MPVGMQLIGKQLSEDVLLQIGNAYQSVTEWHKMRPGGIK